MLRNNIFWDYKDFRVSFARATKIVAFTGEGINAESGIPTFNNRQDYWGKYKIEKLATPQAFEKNPGLVWQFYEYRRQLVLSKEPNAAHLVLTQLETKLLQNSPEKQIIVVTQNVDELHKRSGMKRVLELNGSIFKTRCTKCKLVKANYINPIVPALADIKIDEPDRNIDPKDLPRCEKCSGLLRPNVVWFGESLDPAIMSQAEGLMNVTDLLLVIGTSSVVYPAVGLVRKAASRKVTIAEFNVEKTNASDSETFYFQGACTETLPKAIDIGDANISSLVNDSCSHVRNFLKNST